MDSAGNVYVLSPSESKQFPVTSRAFDRKVNGFDAVVSKLDPSGSELIWSTFLGGSSGDCSPAVDALGAVYVVGSTQSADFPTTPGAFDTTHNGGFDAFGCQAGPERRRPRVQHVLGGAGDDLGFKVAVDGAGAAYVAGGADAGRLPDHAGGV